MPKYGYKLVSVENYVEEVIEFIDKYSYRIKPYVAIIKIEICDDAKIVSPSPSHKKRCSKCRFIKVVAIHKVFNSDSHIIENTLDNNNRIKVSDIKNKIIFSSLFNNNFIYEKNKDIYPDYFDNYKHNVCTNGIHYFDTIKEVKKFYQYNDDFVKSALILN